MIREESGFIALISAIIISALLLTLAVTIGLTGIFGRFNILDSESKERSLALAEACADTVILKLSVDQDYVLTAADHNITVIGSDTCNIVSISPVPPRSFPITIQTQGVINKSYSNLIVVIDADYAIVSWKEVNHF